MAAHTLISRFNRLLAGVISSALLLLPMTSYASAISTADFARSLPTESQTMAADEKALDSLLQREDLRQAFLELGVEAAEVEARIQALSPREQAQLAQYIDEMPAGAGVIELVGVVFVVLMILELVGVTNIFTAF